MPQWIEFSAPLRTKSGTTFSWSVYAKESVAFLGTVKWFGRWRRYAFFPEPETVFEIDCLSALAEFLRQKTQERVAEARQGKEKPRASEAAE